MSKNKESSINQTQFSFEEPFFEDVTVPVDPKQAAAEAPSQKGSKKLLIVIGLSGFLVLIFGVLVLVYFSRGKQIDEQQEEKLVEQTTTSNPFQERITTAREELKDADPTKQDLSYPPIDMVLRLDPKPRR